MRSSETPALLHLVGCTVDLHQHSVIAASGETTQLTTKEAQLLAYLAFRPSVIVPRDELLREVWGYADSVLSRAADHTVTRLRRKIEDNPTDPVHLLTIHGTGYRFEPQVSAKQTPRPPPRARPLLVFESCIVDLGRRRVTRGDEEDRLTSIEAELLTFLVDRAGATVSREELLRKVWGRAWTAGDRTVDVAMRRLRTRIEADSADPHHLVTVRGEGYRLDGIEHPASPPSGRVTLVCTSLTDAGRLWDAEPEAMMRAVDQCADLLSGLAEKWGAYLASQSGHRFQLAFQDSKSALEWCIAAQEKLLDVPWPPSLLMCPEAAEVRTPSGRTLARGPRVAMAVHAGQPHTRVDGATGRTDYLGPVAVHASAILELTAGGQILTSRATLAALDPRARQQLRATELGECGLPGSPDNRQLFSLVPHSIAGRTFASTQARARLLATLPVNASSFVGRSDEMRRLAELVSAHRLVAIHGAAGIGKSRLALQFALERVAQFPGGVHWCHLKSAESERDLTTAIATELGLGSSQEAPRERIARALAGRGATLIVLDGFDGLVSDGSAALQQWQVAAPEATFLPTSRQLLGLRTEVVLELGPLSVDCATELFQERSPTDVADEDLLASLVQRLDGVPLAIEFAAARSAVLPPALLLERISTGLHNLGGTLQAAIESSWEGLTPAEKAGLTALSVFPSQFSLAAAEAVMDCDAIDVLQGLRDKSLLKSWAPFERPDSVRFRVYESIAQYAKSLAPAESTAEYRRRYTLFYAGYGERAYQASLYRAGGLERTAEMALERPNLYTAATWALEDGAVQTAALATLAHLQVLLLKGIFDTDVTLAQTILQSDVLPSVTRSRLCRTLGACLRTTGQVEASYATLQEALDLADDARARINTLCQMGTVARHLPEVDAEPLFEAALQLAKESGHRDLVGVALDCLGVLTSRDHRKEEAEKSHQEALAIHLEAGDVRRAAFTRFRLGMLAASNGNLDLARNHLSEALKPALVMRDRRFEVMIRNNLAIYLHHQGRIEAARTHLEAALLCFAGQGDPNEASVHSLLAVIGLQLGEEDEASDRFAEAERSTALIKVDLHRAASVGNLAEYSLYRGDLEGARARAEETLRLLRPGPSPARGFALRILAHVALHDGDLEGAESQIIEAEDIMRRARSSGELVPVLCLKGRIAAARSDRETASDAHREAADIAATMGCLASSHLAVGIRELEGEL